MRDPIPIPGRTSASITPPDIVTFVSGKKWLNLPLSIYQETLLRAIYGLPLPTPQHHAIYTQCTGRASYTPRAYREVTVICGARGGKDSRIAAPIAVYEACFGGHHRVLSPGERGVIPVVAQDYKAGRIAFDFIKEYLQRTPACAQLIADIRASEIDLTNGLSIEVFPCTHRALRGWSFPVGILDEVAFFRLEGAANSDAEVQVSIQRGQAQFKDRSRLVKISTPYLRDGILYDDFKRGFGTDDPHLLVWRARTTDMNPTITASSLSSLRARMDASRFTREFEAEFTEDVDAFLPTSVIESATMRDRHQIPPNRHAYWYVAAIDASGGRNDAFTASIAHVEGLGAELRVVQDVLLGFFPRGGALDLEATVKEIAATLTAFDCVTALSDKYAAGWLVEAFARHGITLEAAPEKSIAYIEMHPLFLQGRIAILDHPTQARELALLERHHHQAGRMKIEHPPRGHDDHANVLALATYGAVQAAKYPIDVGGSWEDDDAGYNWLEGW